MFKRRVCGRLGASWRVSVLAALAMAGAFAAAPGALGLGACVYAGQRLSVWYRRLP